MPTTLYQYDDAGNLTQETDSDGNQTRYTYDRLNRQASEALHVGGPAADDEGYTNSSSAYDVDGNLIAFTDHNGNQFTYVYNAANEQVSETTTQAGEVAPVVTMSATYDVMGRLLSEQDTQSVYSYTYDALGQVLSVTSTLAAPGGPAAVGADLTSQITFSPPTYFDNGANLPAGDYRVEYVSGSVDYGDGQGYRVNGNGTFTITYPGGSMTAPGTSATGLTAQQAEAQSQGQFVIIHSTGGPIGVSLDDGVYYDYNNVTAGSGGAPTFRLMSLSPVAGAAPVSTYGTTYTYTYDISGRQSSTSAEFGSSLDHTEALTYDDLGRLKTQTQTAAGSPTLEVDHTYDPSGQMLTVQRYANGVAAIHSQYTYDFDGRLTRLQHTAGSGAGGSNIDTYNLTYDADSRMTVFSSSSDGTAVYTYDANGQLLTTTGSAANPAGETYDYDPEGNRLVSDDLSGNQSSIGEDNRLLQSGDFSYSYDGAGNRLTSFNITTSNYSAKAGSGGMGAYDYRNRLTSITTTGPTPTDGSPQTQNTAIYTYDVDNDRIGREVIDQANDATPTLEEAYAYDNGQMSLVIDPTTTSGNTMGPTAPVTYSIAERIMETPGEADHPIADVNAQTGVVTWLLGDQEGSIRDSVTNGSNYHVQFDSYGNVIGTNQPKRFGYTGHEQDSESGLVYMNARYYDPTTGTFISQDPTGFGSGDSNLYRYTGNSPTDRTDPTGDSWLSSILDNWFGIDKDKTFGIPNKTFVGDLLEGTHDTLRYSIDGFGDLFKGNWSQLNMDGFNYGYSQSGVDEIVRNTPIHTVGVDFGFIGGSVSYDPGTGLRSLSFNLFGAYLQQSENGRGGLETYLGGHAGIGVGPFELGVTGAGSVDHWRQGFGSASLGLFNNGVADASLDAGISSDAQGRLSESVGVGVGLSSRQTTVGLSAGYDLLVGPDGQLSSAANYSAGLGWDPRNKNAEYDADRNAWVITSNDSSPTDNGEGFGEGSSGGSFGQSDSGWLNVPPAGPNDPPQPGLTSPTLPMPPAGSLPPHRPFVVDMAPDPEDANYSALDNAPAVPMPSKLPGYDPNTTATLVGVQDDSANTMPISMAEKYHQYMLQQIANGTTFNPADEPLEVDLGRETSGSGDPDFKGDGDIDWGQIKGFVSGFVSAASDPNYLNQVELNLLNSATKGIIGIGNSLLSLAEANGQAEYEGAGGTSAAFNYQLPNPNWANGIALENYNNAFNNSNAISLGTISFGLLAPEAISSVVTPAETGGNLVWAEYSRISCRRRECSDEPVAGDYDRRCKLFGRSAVKPATWPRTEWSKRHCNGRDVFRAKS